MTADALRSLADRLDGATNPPIQIPVLLKIATEAAVVLREVADQISGGTEGTE